MCRSLAQGGRRCPHCESGAAILAGRERARLSYERKRAAVGKVVKPNIRSLLKAAGAVRVGVPAESVIGVTRELGSRETRENRLAELRAELKAESDPDRRAGLRAAFKAVQREFG